MIYKNIYQNKKGLFIICALHFLQHSFYMITRFEYRLRKSGNISFHSKFMLQLPGRTKSELGHWHHSHLNLCSSWYFPFSSVFTPYGSSPTCWETCMHSRSWHGHIRPLTEIHLCICDMSVKEGREKKKNTSLKAAQWNPHICKSIHPSVHNRGLMGGSFCVQVTPPASVRWRADEGR